MSEAGFFGGGAVTLVDGDLVAGLCQCVGCRNANAAGAHNRDVHFWVESAEVPGLSSGCSYHYRSVCILCNCRGREGW